MYQYKIFDVKRPLMEDYCIVHAKNARQALQTYLDCDEKNEGIKFIKSSDIDCRFCAQKLPYGRKCWFAVKRESI